MAKDSFKADTGNNNLSYLYIALCCLTDNDLKSDFVAFSKMFLLLCYCFIYGIVNNYLLALKRFIGTQT